MKASDAGAPSIDGYAPLEPSRALTPHAVRVNATLVRRGFWPKVRKVAASAPFAEDLVALWFAARDPETSWRTKATILAALAWFVLPRRFVPKRLTALLWADEAAVIALAVKLTGESIREAHRAAARRVLARLAK